jgi:hypothetical protein
MATGGRSTLRAIHNDLAAYNHDTEKVTNAVLYGGNVSGDLGAWQSALSVFGQDAETLQNNPAPACAGGAHVARAAADWAKAVAAYQAAAQILASSPGLVKNITKGTGT